MMSINRKKRADQWRDNNDLTGGIVVFFESQIQGWVNVLRDPQQWQPGCIAVDEAGSEFVATGGNSYEGADQWVQASRVT